MPASQGEILLSGAVFDLDAVRAQRCQMLPERGARTGFDAQHQGQRKIRLLAQAGNAAEREDAAIGHDGQAIDALLEFGQDMRGDQDRDALFAQPLQHGVEVVDGRRVQTVGGLIEKEHARRAKQGLGKTEPLPHALE